LATFVISKERVYSAHENKDLISGIVPASKSGKNVKKEVSAYDKDFVREYIKSFPKVNCHYRRKQTSKEYLESYLNINKIMNYMKRNALNRFVVQSKIQCIEIFSIMNSILVSISSRMTAATHVYSSKYRILMI
jgi:hypothetical protein